MSLTLKVALIQSPLIWENPERNRAVFDEKIAAVAADVDVIVLPEMFTTGFTMQPQNVALDQGQKTVDWMQSKAQEKQMALVGSMVFSENDKFYNRLFFVTPNASPSWYDKRHTFTLAGEDAVYESGTELLLEEFKGFKICPLICYDLRFPVWARNTVDYDVLIYVANWPEPRIGAWDALLKARAIENMSYTIGVNRIGDDEVGHRYSGHSAVYDVLGERLVFSQKEETLYTTLSKTHITSVREKLKFLDDRDEFNLLG